MISFILKTTGNFFSALSKIIIFIVDRFKNYIAARVIMSSSNPPAVTRKRKPVSNPGVCALSSPKNNKPAGFLLQKQFPALENAKTFLHHVDINDKNVAEICSAVVPLDGYPIELVIRHDKQCFLYWSTKATSPQTLAELNLKESKATTLFQISPRVDPFQADLQWSIPENTTFSFLAETVNGYRKFKTAGVPLIPGDKAKDNSSAVPEFLWFNDEVKINDIELQRMVLTDVFADNLTKAEMVDVGTLLDPEQFDEYEEFMAKALRAVRLAITDTFTNSAGLALVRFHVHGSIGVIAVQRLMIQSKFSLKWLEDAEDQGVLK